VIRLVACCVVVACGPSSATKIDAPPASDSVVADARAIWTIAALRQSPPPDGTIVTLPAVVVVVHVSSKTSGSVWVQDAGGGTYSGIHVFCNYAAGCALQQGQIDALAVGTVVTVTGTFKHYLANPAASPELEIDAPAITSTGDTMQPAAVDAAAADVAKDATGDAYRGTYVRVTGSAWTASTITPAEMAGTCIDRSMPPQTGSQFSGFEATGGGATLAVGLGFHDTLTYCLPCTGVPLPYACTNAVTQNQMFGKLQGIVDADWGNGAVFLRVSPVLDGDL
jgi:hypothetical protein